MSNKYSVEFQDAAGSIRTVVVELPADETARAGDSEVHAFAYAIRRGYQRVPPGFHYVVDGGCAAVRRVN